MSKTSKRVRGMVAAAAMVAGIAVVGGAAPAQAMKSTPGYTSQNVVDCRNGWYCTTGDGSVSWGDTLNLWW